MSQRKKAFTLIELIIVVVIIAILALIAIPRYHASVVKTKRVSAYKTLHDIRNVLLAYYAVNGVYPLPGGWPFTNIRVTIDGDTIYNFSNPSNKYWQYAYFLDGGYADLIVADPAGSGWQPDCYGVRINSGAELDWSDSSSLCRQ
ncbi:MAG: prepilin-type N-terminal cleavage/methylation domain-containing protein [Candidatus Omnitrophica bacterium]|jgi:prepilin-type N-terminal cleavage/methylation domain-containing protein|nr:prepilin-type N-terminal cleavage/methylation domain-containing protein [Candidatus Omnitrophota bacterium]